MNIDKDLQTAIMESCDDESTKVILYLKEQSKKQKSYNLAMLILTIISATGAAIAAITGILMFFQ